MKKSLFIALMLLCHVLAFAQNELLVQSSDKGPYLSHTVVPKENFYSVGRLFNTSPKDIAAFNGLDMNKGLTIGEEIRIPLNATNYSQSKDNGRPVYYVVGQKEGLYRVSLKNNTVLMANLRKWNHLATDNISTGQKLIVGFLVSPEAQNIAADLPKKDVPTTDMQDKPPPPVVRQNPPVETVTPEKATPKKEDPPKRTEPEKRPETTPVRPPGNAVAADGSGGYFRSQYEQQLRSQPAKVDETASTGIFKTASGWQDAKYYALMDHVDPGTIIRVVNPTNNKVIYAKVLGEMSGIRQNQGYDVRISNAAASALDVADTEKFIVRIFY
jgi:LysM repeat protein